MSVVLAADLDDASNAGAQRGSLLHEGIEAFHRTLDDKEGLAAMLRAGPKFPLADLATVEKWYAAYVADPKNQMKLEHIEQKVALRYKSVVIAGTLDQLRFDSAALCYRVWDVKTGSYLTPGRMLLEYECQQAAYVLAARETLGLDVRPGGLIRIHGYSFKRGDVFLGYPDDLNRCRELLDVVVEKVVAVRAGRRDFTPSDDACRFCPARPHPTCTEVRP